MFNYQPEVVTEKLLRRIPNYIRFTFLSSFIIGLLTHAFMFLNKLPNTDEINQVLCSMSRASSGRWFLKYPTDLSSTFSMPWVNGLLSLVYLSVAACLVVACLKIYKKFYCVLISALMISIPIVASTLAYMQSADGYFFALMLACMSAYFAGKYKYGFIAAIPVIVLSLGCYQAYYGVAAGLMIMIVIFELLDNQIPWKKTLFKGLRFVCSLGLGMVGYFVMVKLKMPSAGLTQYRGIDKMGQMPLQELPTRIINAYKYIISYFLLNRTEVHYSYMALLFAVSFLCCAVLIVIWCLNRKMYKEPMRIALILLLLFLFPLGCSIVRVMDPLIPHMIMIYGVTLVPIFLVAVTASYWDLSPMPEHKTDIPRKKSLQATAVSLSRWVITSTIVVCIFNYFIVSNQAYFRLIFAYEQTYAKSITLVSRIQEIEGYSWDKEIVLVGKPFLRENTPNSMPELHENAIRNTADFDELWYSYSYPRFLERFIGFSQKVTFISRDIKTYPEIVEVITGKPRYPDEGSIFIVE
ncbi:MAG: glucosyltransferase domain-containing protein, partial [Oscillospiraceae bacterium]|nr:glucosyltransferase domain-containing protein [Oscillospiraceae bacterium]